MQCKNVNNAINMNPYFPGLHLPSWTKLRWEHDFNCVVFDGECAAS